MGCVLKHLCTVVSDSTVLMLTLSSIGLTCVNTIPMVQYCCCLHKLLF